MRFALKLPCRHALNSLLFSSALLIAAHAAAQDPRNTDFARAAATLPRDSRMVVNRLLSLRALPDSAWKSHTGDLPHGEDVNLDDSAWQTVAQGYRAPNDAVWFRRTIQIPDTLHGYDLSGARIWFQFNVASNDPATEMLYFNGRRVAMGEDLEPVVLLESAQPGDKITVAVKLLHTIDLKSFRGASMRIDIPAARPNPLDLCQEFLSAALLVPSLAPGNTEDMDTLEHAIHTVDIAALDHAASGNETTRTESQVEFDTSLKTAQNQLEALRPLLQQATVHLTGNSHIDAAWLWPWTETVDVVRRTFATALQLMNEYPDYTYTESAAAYNDWIAQKYPDMNAEIAKRIKEGRWEIVGGMWVEPDLNMSDGESLVRQLLVGKRWYKQAYGVDVRIGWNPDSFGYNWQLPQIYKKSGIDYFVTQKMTWNDTNQLPFKLFWWQSPDGSKVLTYFPHDYSNSTLNPVRLSEDMSVARQRSTGMTEMMDLYGVGDHGGGPTREVLDEGQHWANPGAANVTPKYEFGTAQSYFSSVEKTIAPDSPVWNYQSIAKGYTAPPAVADKVSIPTWNSELYFEYHRGVLTSQANQKHNMRIAEEQMLNAEKWSSLAWVLPGRGTFDYPGAELTDDWKKVLFNQFHDLAAGSGIGVIYKDAQKDYDVVQWSTNAIDAGALRTVAAKIDTRLKDPKAIPLVVFNPLGWSRAGDVTVQFQLPDPGMHGLRVIDVAANTAVPWAQIAADQQTGIMQIRVHVDDVPALGYKLLAITPEKTADAHAILPIKTGEDANVMTLEDQWVRVAVDKKTGCITSIKRDGIEALAPGACGNEFQAFKDTPRQWDAWNIDPGTLDETPTVFHKADSVMWNEQKSARPGIRVFYTWQNSKFQQTIRLSGDVVDFDSQFDWHEKHVLLKAAFPLAVSSDFATYEIPYGAIQRSTTRNNNWERAQFEVPALRWADLSGAGADGKVRGMSLLNQEKYGYDTVGNVLRLSMLRSPIWPDPDADQQHHHFHYALYFHAGSWQEAQTVRHGWEYDYPITALVTTAHAGSLPAAHSFVSVSPENVVLTAVKKAEDQNGLGVNGLILRVYESAGKDATVDLHVPPGATGATATNLMEQPEGNPLPVTGDDLKAPIHPWEILTLRVDYPKQ